MANPALVFDGVTTVEGGMNDGDEGSLLRANQVQLAINATCRNGFIAQRPGHRRVMQILPPGAGLYQHTGWLRQRNGNVLLVAVAGGRFYRIDPLAKTVAEFTISGDANPATLMQGWSIPGGAEGFWIYNDGQTLPLIWNGSSARRATFNELKTGTVLTYVQGRIWYALPDGLSFRAGDLVGSKDSGTAAYAYKDSILRETENTYLNEGGDFAVPFSTGGITAMAATAQLDTSQGQGPLQVFCLNGGFSVNTPVDRTIWKDVQYPIQTVSLLGSGFLGAQSTINVNGDIFGRATDGIRSYIVARRNFRDWGNTPQSFEVSGLIGYDQQDLLPFGSAALFDNRLLMTCSPRWTGAGVSHRGLIALDLTPISSILNQGIPHYDGMWTGLEILTIVQTEIGAYMTVLCADGSVDLWELTRDAVYDYYDAITGRVQWTVVPRRLFVERDSATRPTWTVKRLETADLLYDRLGGAVDFELSWKPDAFPCWTSWKAWQECAPVCTTSPGCVPPSSFQRQYRPRMRLSQPPDVCVPGSKGLPLRHFYQLDVRLDVTGPARLRGVRIGAVPQGEPSYAPNCDFPDCEPITCCELDPFFYVAHGTAGTSGGSGGSGAGGDGPGTGGTTDEDGNDDGTGGLEPPPPPDDPDDPGNPNNPDDPPAPPTPPPITGPDEPFVSFGETALTFIPEWPDPEDPGTTYPLAFESAGDPLTSLQPGILELWVEDLKEMFISYAAANGISYTSAQLFFKVTSGAELAMNPSMFFQDPPLNFKAGWTTSLWIEYTI